MDAWKYLGYEGAGNVSSLLGSLRGRRAAVCGSGWGVFDEYQRFVKPDDVVFAVNDVAMYLPRVDHFVSRHGERLALWSELRRDPFGVSNGNTDFKTHFGTINKESDPRFNFTWLNIEPVSLPLSGLFAMQVAYLMGVDSMILIGIPSDNTPRFWETQTKNWAYGDLKNIKSLKMEMLRLPEFFRKVKSASGFTREFFGAIPE